MKETIDKIELNPNNIEFGLNHLAKDKTYCLFDYQQCEIIRYLLKKVQFLEDELRRTNI